MPRLTHQVPKYRKHRASGQAIVNIAGKDHYLGPHGTKASHVAYDRIIAEYLAAGRQLAHPPSPAPSVTVVEVLAALWKHCKVYYVKDGKPTHEQAAFKRIIRDTRKLYGPIPAADFGPKSLKAIRHSWLLSGQSRKTINQNARRLKSIFRWAASEELVPVAIHQALATVAGLKKGRTEAPENLPVLPIEHPSCGRSLPDASDSRFVKFSSPSRTDTLVPSCSGGRGMSRHVHKRLSVGSSWAANPGAVQQYEPPHGTENFS